MRNTRFDNHEAGPSVGRAPHQETALFLAGLSFGLAMLSLFAVLLLADIVALGRILPLFALPLALFIASAPLFRRWAKSEADAAAIEGVARQASQPPPPAPTRASTREVDPRRQQVKPTAATRP
jgi:hypothetical protein